MSNKVLELDYALRSSKGIPMNKIFAPQGHVWTGKTSQVLTEALRAKKDLTILLTDAEGSWRDF